MMLDQTAIVHGVFDIVEGTAPPSSGRHLAATLDIVLAAVTLAALTLGACGVVRAGRWARRRRGAPLRTALGLLPAVAVLGAGAAFPRLAEAWIGRDVTWRAAAYGWPALVVFVLAALLAAAATLLARAWQWRRTDGATSSPRPACRRHRDRLRRRRSRPSDRVAATPFPSTLDSSDSPTREGDHHERPDPPDQSAAPHA